MEIEIHPEIADLIKGMTKDPEGFVNDILLIYAKGGFIRASETTSTHHITKVFRKNCNQVAEDFDEATQEFKGVAVVGQKESETLFIPDEDLHDAIAENDCILVMKSPRKEGISIQEGNDTRFRPVEKHV